MTDTFMITFIFVALTVGIWFSYRLFMRGDTNEERVAKHLPPDFKPEWSYRHGDTYVGYEQANDRLAIVDYPYGAVLKAREVQSIEPFDEGTMGIMHRWLKVKVPQTNRELRLWFGLSSAKRDAMLAKLKGIVAAK
ncbi:MAG: hypothetical protein ACXWG1_16205 [Usitatibacter sp.]